MNDLERINKRLEAIEARIALVPKNKDDLQAVGDMIERCVLRALTKTMESISDQLDLSDLLDRGENQKDSHGD